MASNLLVSVVIPNYCHSKFLDQRICSVLNQTYQNIEVIILDDCSPDNGASKSVIEKYRDDKRISHIVYNEINSGNTFIQWEKGIKFAKGSVIWIAESDDFCEPNMLEELLKEYNKHKDSAIVYTSYRLADENGNAQKLGNGFLSKLRRRVVGIRHYTGTDFINRCLTYGNCIENASTAIFSKEAYERIDKEYIQYKGAGDYLFWVKLAEQGSVSKLNQGLSFFRRHTNVVTFKSDANGQNFIANRKILDYIRSKQNISAVRWSLIKHHQKFRINRTIFLDDETKKLACNSWDAYSGTSFLVKTLFWLQNNLIKYFDIYL